MNSCRLPLFGLTILCVSAAAATQTLPDPTRPPMQSSLAQQADSGNASAFRLQALFIGTENPRAMIENEMVYEGQTWRGMTVLRIDHSGVVLQSPTTDKGVPETHSLTLKNNNFIQDASNDF